MPKKVNLKLKNLISKQNKVVDDDELEYDLDPEEAEVKSSAVNKAGPKRIDKQLEEEEKTKEDLLIEKFLLALDKRALNMSAIKEKKALEAKERKAAAAAEKAARAAKKEADEAIKQAKLEQLILTGRSAAAAEATSQTRKALSEHVRSVRTSGLQF